MAKAGNKLVAMEKSEYFRLLQNESYVEMSYKTLKVMLKWFSSKTTKSQSGISHTISILP